jgi:hypothetical protein
VRGIFGVGELSVSAVDMSADFVAWGRFLRKEVDSLLSGGGSESARDSGVCCDGPVEPSADSVLDWAGVVLREGLETTGFWKLQTRTESETHREVEMPARKLSACSGSAKAASRAASSMKVGPSPRGEWGSPGTQLQGSETPVAQHRPRTCRCLGANERVGVKLLGGPDSPGLRPLRTA